MTVKTNDPQLKVVTCVKQSKRSDSDSEFITFLIPMGLFELACIVPIPSEGETRGVAYIKHKVRFPTNDLNHGNGHLGNNTDENTD